MPASPTKISVLTVTLPSDREIFMTRRFSAPARLVYEAWTKPEHVKQWWGCPGSSVPVCEIDLRVGGPWRWVLRNPDGSEHTFKGVYREIVPYSRLVYTECFDDPRVGRPEWLRTNTFEEQDGETIWTARFLHPSRQNRDGHVGSSMEKAASQIYDRLAEYLRGKA